MTCSRIHRSQAPAVDRASNILKYVSENNGVTYSQIYQNFDIPQSSVSNLLHSLVVNGLLRQSNGKYYLGLILHEYGLKAVEQFNIKEIAQPILEELSDKTTLACHLGVLDNKSAIYLSKVESKNIISIKTWIGKRLSLHSSSLGKILLAWLSKEELDEIIPFEILPKNTEQTIGTKTELIKNLMFTKERGWASDDNEDAIGVSCIAAPIFDSSNKVIAAISTSGVNFQVKDKEAIAALVIEAARKLTQELSGS